LVIILFCGVDHDQIISYLEGSKDTEIRKTKPNTEKRLGKKLIDVPILIKVMGANFGYLIGHTDEIIEKKNPKELWELNGKYKFGVSKTRFFEYFLLYKGKVKLIHFKKIDMIYPPITSFPSYQTWAYINLPEDTKTYPLSNDKIREKLLTKTREIKKQLENR